MEGYIGQIILFAGSFAPRAWAFCNGQLLSIAQNTALFSILGTTYGGNGQTTFALPDLRGRVPAHAGHGGPGPGLTERNLGENGGAEAVQLQLGNLPAHSHRMRGTTTPASRTVPTNRFLARAEGGAIYGSGPDTMLALNALSPAGSDQPHANMQPWLGLNYIICLEGIFPSRN